MRFDKSGPCYAVIIDSAETTDTGTYTVRAVNEAGEASSTADFEVGIKWLKIGMY